MAENFLMHGKKRKQNMTSKERLIGAISRKEVDYVPCSPGFNSLRAVQRVGRRWQFPWGPSEVEQVDYCVNELGVDPAVGIPIGNHYPEPGVSTKVWIDNDIIHKKWITPSGELHASIKYNQLWPFGLDIPFYHDFTAHYIEPWIKSFDDLNCLKHILLPLRTRDQYDYLKFTHMQARKLADRYQLATIAHIGSGLTGALQMFGPNELCMMTLDQPDLVDEYLELEHQVNLCHMKIVLDLGADIISRNGFYETADFYNPVMLEQFLGKRLREEIETVHQASCLIGYTVHTGIMPMLDYLKKFEFDSIDYIDIAFKGTALHKIKQELGATKSFWAGPSNTYHMWSEDPEEVRKAVRKVFDVFGKTGLILSACPSSHSIMPWENTLAMIDEWKKLY